MVEVLDAVDIDVSDVLAVDRVERVNGVDAYVTVLMKIVGKMTTIEICSQNANVFQTRSAKQMAPSKPSRSLEKPRTNTAE